MFKYFSGKLSPGFMAVYSGRMILTITGQLFGLFLPIFLYQIFDFNLSWVIIYYIIRDVLYLFTIPLGCRSIMNKIGLKNSLRLGVIFGSLFYVAFYILEITLTNSSFGFSPEVWTFSMLGASIIILNLNRISYWVPLHTDMAKFTTKKNRARQLSLIAVTQLILGASMPLLAGWIITVSNYGVLFMLGIVIYLVALIPFSKLPDTKAVYSWSYRKTWKEIFSKKKRNTMIAYAGDGAENMVGAIIWPIFIWELLNGNYFEVGLISSLIVVATVALQLVVGKKADKGNKKKMLRYGSWLYAAGWIIKIFIATSFQIFITSTYHNLVKVFARTSFDALYYEDAADEGHYIDEYTATREMALSAGRVIMNIFILILLPFLSIELTFIFAALAALSWNFISETDHEEQTKRLES